EDELGMVLRAHIHVEASLNELLDLVIPVPEYLPSLRYRQRVELACAMGLKSQYRPPLIVLGEIRNAFAHKLDSQLSEERIAKLYQAFAAEDRELFQASYEGTKSRMLVEKGPAFLDLSPRDHFVIMALVLKSALVTAVFTLKKKYGNA
ncbi:MAG: hypothetical protein ACREUV_07665, partial [Burkholderiales bacterium]